LRTAAFAWLVAAAEPRVVVVVIDGLPTELLEQELPRLPFLSSRTPHHATAVSCYPSTTGPAYFPLLAGVTPGAANVPGIRWFDRTRPTRSRFPHRGLRSYVGPDAAKMESDTAAETIFARHAWPASTPVGKDSPKAREKSRDLLWALAHFFETWDWADRRTAWKLGRGLTKGRPIVFAVFPSVDEYGHMLGLHDARPAEALQSIDALLAEKLADYNGQVIVTADHGLTATDTHLDLRALVEERVGPTLAFPLTPRPDPAAVVCESGNAFANVYLRSGDGWRKPPSTAACRRLGAELAALDGIHSVAWRSERPGEAAILCGGRAGLCGVREGGLFQEGEAFANEFAGLEPRDALAASKEEENPDAAFALSSLLASERAGDLLVSAEVGFDLRGRAEWPEHHASHGALHRSHTVVPVRSSAPLPPRPLRTLDVFAETLRLAGIELAEYPQSDCALIDAGRWAPRVLR
jgi:hypothetical protein